MKYSLQKRISAFVLAFALVMTTAFNSVGVTTANAAALKCKSLKANKSSVSVVEGSSVKVTVTQKFNKKSAAKISVSSSDKSVATVSKKLGKKAKSAKATLTITGVAAGTATITVKSTKKTKKTKKIKVTVTAKSEPATTTAVAPATTQASADATTQAPQQDASADASGDSLKGVSLSITAPKVGDVVKAIINPSTAKDVAKYAWFVGGKEVSGNATASYTVPVEDLGKTIQVVVTTTAGTEFKSDISAAVIEDNSTKAEITDLSGFQANGSAMLGDVLDLTFGDGLGIPAQITWYVNNKLVATYNSNNGSLDQIQLDTKKKAVTGNCYAIIKNEAGETFKSNVVSIVDSEVAATISDFSITEDYTDANNIKLTDSSAKYVITAKLNKDYAGKFYLIEASKDANTTNAGGNVWDIAADGLFWSSTTTPITGVIAKSDSELTPKNGLNKDYKYTNESTHSVTYMFNVKAALKRGTKYALVFDQTGVPSSKIETTGNNTQAITSSAVVADYVKAPKLIKITNLNDVTSGSIASTFYSDDAGKVVADYLGGSTGLTVKYYADKNYDEKEGDEFSATTITKGVVSGGTITADPDYVSVYAIATGAAGVFSKDSITLKSKYRLLPVTEPGTISVSTVSASKDALKVSISGQKDSGKVYLLKGIEQFGADSANIANKISNASAENATLKLLNTSATSSPSYTITTPAQLNNYNSLKAISNFKASDAETYKSCGEVPLTAGSYTFTNIVTGLGDTYSYVNNTNPTNYGIKYVAVFVPNSEQFKTVNSYGSDALVKSVPTTFSYAGATNTVGADLTNAEVKLIVKDQFGTDLTAKTYVGDGVAFNGTFKPATDLTEDYGFTLAVTAAGAVSVGGLDSTDADGSTKEKLASNMSWKFSTDYGTFTLTVDTLGADENINTSKFKLSFTAK